MNPWGSTNLFQSSSSDPANRKSQKPQKSQKRPRNHHNHYDSAAPNPNPNPNPPPPLQDDTSPTLPPTTTMHHTTTRRESSLEGEYPSLEDNIVYQKAHNHETASVDIDKEPREDELDVLDVLECGDMVISDNNNGTGNLQHPNSSDAPLNSNQNTRAPVVDLTHLLDEQQSEQQSQQQKQMKIELPSRVMNELESSAASRSNEEGGGSRLMKMMMRRDHPILEHDHNNNHNNEDDNDQQSARSERSLVSTASRGSMLALKHFATRTTHIAILILLVGATASAIILGSGIRNAHSDQQDQFNLVAKQVVTEFHDSMNRFTRAGLWIHQACFRDRDTMTQRDFRVVYEYFLASGLNLNAIAFVTPVTHDQRAHVENRTREYLQAEYPPSDSDKYQGFNGYNVEGNASSRGYRDEADSYLTVQFVEPLSKSSNFDRLGLDIATVPHLYSAAQQALQTFQPALSRRIQLRQDDPSLISMTIAAPTNDRYTSIVDTKQPPQQQQQQPAGALESTAFYSTVLFHPGIPLSTATPAAVAQQPPRDLAAAVIRMPEVFYQTRGSMTMDHQVSLYIYDSTDSSTTEGGDQPLFMGGAVLHADQVEDNNGDLITFIDEIELRDIKHRYLYERRVTIASREWTFVVVGQEDSFSMNFTFIVLGGTMIFVASACLALWMITNHRKMANINRIKQRAEAEKANIRVEHALAATHRERELNGFLSHEVRNPISAAISACSFVHSAIQDNTNEDTGEIIASTDERKMIVEDIGIIDSSLQFVNDLLRNMLDMHRASSNQIKIDYAPVDILRDILEPVASMLYQRGSDFQVLLDCPEGLIVSTDKLRLKQTILNLGRNSTKFVTTGFVRLRAAVVDGIVHLYVEDSGPGIPEEKKAVLFGKFQDALDSLSQGTGLGLSLCKKLMELMNGELYLDESYESGISGYPGARFVVNLRVMPLPREQQQVGDSFRCLSTREPRNSAIMFDGRTLPENLHCLIVDDEFTLRQLFARHISRVTKGGWKIREASNGETALRLTEEQTFDIIFMDQYMASVAKQLLGTETVKALRARGVTTPICGLSANDVEKPFLQAGANMFIMKPLPTDQKELTQALFRILDSAGNHTNAKLIPNNISKPPHGTARLQVPKSGSIRSLVSVSDKEYDLADILPVELSVLVCDDDNNLRQLLVRSLERVAPNWNITNVPDGETALEMVEKQQFDLIFLDHCMNSAQKERPMLGTETAFAMRAKGVTSIICGCSGNDINDAFLEAGANYFILKPYPCEKGELTKELVKMLNLELPAESAPLDDKSAFSATSSSHRADIGNSLETYASARSDEKVRTREVEPEAQIDLPETLSVLLAEDSPSLRKMFSRSLLRAASGWSIEMVESGEAALEIIDSGDKEFDLIFLDQHMGAGMLGTDAAKALRERGVTSIICGLSGDDVEYRFIYAGANCFVIKPFPCKKEEMQQELKKILQTK